MANNNNNNNERKARVRNYVRNINNVYRQATENERAEGAAWYAEAFRIIATIAAIFGIDPVIASAVCAALSPNNSWSGNLLDLQKVLAAYSNGRLQLMAEAFGAADGSYKPTGNAKAFAPLALQTYPANALKAFRILDTLDASVLGKKKVWNFFRNIAFSDAEAVTIDFHAYGIATGARVSAQTCPKISASLQAELSEAYQLAGEKHGLTGYQMQAITWVVWRRIIGIHKSRG